MNRRVSVGAPIATPRRLPPLLPARYGCPSILAGLVLGGLCLSASSARAADLSRDIRTASDEGQYASEITSYVQDEVSKISSDADPAQASQARESLLDNIRGLVDPSPAFLDAYEAQLKLSLANLLAPTNSIRVRLNAAIVIAEVAAKSQDAQLADLIIKELNDPSEAVVLWGLKGAHEVLPPALNVPNLKQQLVTAVQKAAFGHPTSGPVISAAYNALAVGGTAPTDLIAPVQRILDWRIKQYAVGIPPEPPADAIATSFLTERQVWTTAPAQQAGSVQRIADLIVAASAALPAAQQEDHDELIQLLKKTGQAVFVIGINNADPVLQTAATPLTQVDLRPPPMAPLQAAKTAVAGLIAKFPSLRVPSAFAAATAPTAPSAPPASPPPANP